MDQSMSSQGMASGQMAGDHEMEMHDGDDFVCSNCDCEITIKHHGDSAKMTQMRPFTCCCGTQMAKEHAGG